MLEQSPGPSDYRFTLQQVKPCARPINFSLMSGRKQSKEEKTPDPGQYEVKEISNGPSFTIGVRREEQSMD